VRHPESTEDVDVVTLNLVQRIREEFEESPGLRITMKEATRFWGLDQTTCEEVLAQLLATGFLAKGVDGRYRQT
jgi:Fic family protein